MKSSKKILNLLLIITISTLIKNPQIMGSPIIAADILSLLPSVNIDEYKGNLKKFSNHEDIKNYILNNTKALLVIRHPYPSNPYRRKNFGGYIVTPGGKLDTINGKLETIYNAARREIEEETSLEINQASPLYFLKAFNGMQGIARSRDDRGPSISFVNIFILNGTENTEGKSDAASTIYVPLKLLANNYSTKDVYNKLNGFKLDDYYKVADDKNLKPINYSDETKEGIKNLNDLIESRKNEIKENIPMHSKLAFDQQLIFSDNKDGDCLSQIITIILNHFNISIPKKIKTEYVKTPRLFKISDPENNAVHIIKKGNLTDIKKIIKQ
ncbi:MAG: NUDIX domain-containing protein [bacterium]